jgi:hypothetical protein
MASKIVWLDCLITNVDRTARNTNMLIWNKELWLIDHGAALYFHHSWDNWEMQSTKPFFQVKDHVLLPLASELESADIDMREFITVESIGNILQLIPLSWLEALSPNGSPDEIKEVYAGFLINRLNNSRIFLNEALYARQSLI